MSEFLILLNLACFSLCPGPYDIVHMTLGRLLPSPENNGAAWDIGTQDWKRLREERKRLGGIVAKCCALLLTSSFNFFF